MRYQVERMVSTKSIRRIGAVSLIVPCLDHLAAPILTLMFAPVMLETVFGPGWVAATAFFLALGIFQLLWVYVLLKSENSFLLILGILGNLVSILIYFVSTAGVTLFGVPPQPLIAFGVLIKALEAVFVLASICVLKALHTAV